MEIKNIFSEIPDSIPDEIFQEIISSRNCKIERIISKAHNTPEDKWYDQDKNEFVILLKGKAEISFQESDELIRLNPGDYINIPPHKKHRVEKTSSTEETIWLAVHY